MKFKISEDKKFLVLKSSTLLEFDQLVSSFTKKIDAWFVLRKKFPHWDGDVKFFQERTQRVPLGLWGEVKKMAEKFNFSLIIEGNDAIIDSEFLEEDFDAWMIDHFKECSIIPKYFQIEAVKRVLKFMNCTEEISTSGGKTLVAYMIFRYLLDKKKLKKMLYVVPNIGLVEQSEDKFYEYDEKCGYEKPPWESVCIYGGSKRRNEEEADIVFGTFQSLAKKELDYFKKIDAVCIDECLHPDTLITMADFSKKKIKNIKIGEKVWTKNEKTNKFEIKEIDFVYKNLSKENQMFEIEMENGKIIKITGNHKVLLKGNIWKRADELLEEDEIIRMKIKSIKKINYFGDVYNLRIKSKGENNHNYFANDLCVSNCHHSKALSIKNILVKCHNAKWKFGLTGSLPKEGSCDSFTIQAYLGPNVYTFSSHQLIKEGNATLVHVIGIELDYLSDKVKKDLYDLRNVSADEKDGVKLLNLEKQIAREERKRLVYIGETISKAKKNSLVLFADIKNSYGRSIYNWLRENTEKNIYYIDGSTEAEKREFFKKKMEDEENVILVASAGTFSEGIDIQNLLNIYIVESHKSEIVIAQILGRGMRLMPGKEKIMVFDFSDNFQYGTHKWQKKNYLLRHADERRKIYKKRKFPYKLFRIKL